MRSWGSTWEELRTGPGDRKSRPQGIAPVTWTPKNLSTGTQGTNGGGNGLGGSELGWGWGGRGVLGHFGPTGSPVPGVLLASTLELV